jgi:hypothetical protein
MVLNRASAQVLTDATKLLGWAVVWVVSNADEDHSGMVVARAHTADSQGRIRVAGVLTADSFIELRVQMPVGLMPWRRDPYHLPHIIEVWE